MYYWYLVFLAIHLYCQINDNQSTNNMKIKFLLLTAASILTLNACKKSDSPQQETVSASVVGNWTLSELGSDSNNNNTVDAGETSSATAYQGVLNLKADKTFMASLNLGGTISTQAGTYTYANNVITTIPTSGDSKNGTVTVLTANKLVVKRTISSSSTAQWEVYTK